MSKNQVDNTQIKQDAYFAYLEMCVNVQIIPDKEILEIIQNCENAERLDSITSFLELTDGEFMKGNLSKYGIEDTFKDRFIKKFTPKEIILKQMVKFDNESDKEVEQSVNYDPNDHWLIVDHDGHDIPLTRENWYRLIELVKKAEDLI